MRIDAFVIVLTYSILFMFLVLSPVMAADDVKLIPVSTHHVAELNSNQPYVGGYHVNTPDLLTRETVQATAITVGFPSTDPSYFPSGSWLGAGMFVQAQDNKLKHVDYAFYTMLVLDSDGQFYVDLGLHETRESTAPLQMPTEELIYAYTWQISGIDPATPVTLLAAWDKEGFVNYSLSTAQNNVSVTSIHVKSLPNCGSIIPRFYAGNFIAGTAFPFYHYVYYFQFGVVGSQVIGNSYWTVNVKEPEVLRNLEGHAEAVWQVIDTAWSTQGDIAYLDYDWMWGGAPYQGVSVVHGQNPREITFLYTGQTLPRGTVLWQHEQLQNEGSLSHPVKPMDLKIQMDSINILPIEVTVAAAAAAINRKIFLTRFRKKALNRLTSYNKQHETSRLTT